MYLYRLYSLYSHLVVASKRLLVANSGAVAAAVVLGVEAARETRRFVGYAQVDNYNYHYNSWTHSQHEALRTERTSVADGS
jgi:hypothetical protein